MAESYSPANTSRTPLSAGPADARGGMLRPVLWTVLMISAVCNAVTSNADINIAIGIGFGLVTLACAAGLVAHHYTYRRRQAPATKG